MMTVEMVCNNMTLTTVQSLAARQYPRQIARWHVVEMTTAKTPKANTTGSLINIASHSEWALSEQRLLSLANPEAVCQA